MQKRRWLVLWLTLSMILVTLQPALAAFNFVEGGQTAPKDGVCVPLDQLKDGGRYASPLAVGEARFYSDGGFRYAYGVAGDLPAGPNLRWAGTLKVFIPASGRVQIALTHFAGPVTVTAHDGADREVARATSVTPDGALDTLTLTGGDMVKLVFANPGEGVLRALCYNPTGAQNQQPPQDGQQQPADEGQPSPDRQQPADGKVGVAGGCLDFRTEQAGDRAGEFAAGGVTFSSESGASVLDLDGDGALELYFSGTLKAALPAGVSKVKATLVHYGDQVTMEAFGATGASKGVRTTSGGDGAVETLEIDAGAAVISRVVFTTQGKAALIALCREAGGQPAPEEEKEKKEKPEAPRCAASPFADVPARDPACGAVKLLAEAKVVGGYQDGTFRPRRPVTRAEFAKLLVLARGMKPSAGGAPGFKDTAGHWAARQGYLQKAVAIGAINGFPDGTFRPNAQVTRAQAVRIAAGAIADVLAVNAACPAIRDAAAAGTTGTRFGDVPAGAWYAPSLEQAARAGLIGGAATYPVLGGNRLEPDAPLTRLEAAELLANLRLLGTANWDFERGDLLTWTGDRFEDQPVAGDPAYGAGSRLRPVRLGGDYWYGAYPNGHQGDNWFTTGDRDGTNDGDRRTGRLTSQEFTLCKRYIDFLVGGGKDINRLRVELWLRLRPGETPPPGYRREGDFYEVLFTTGNNSEILRREIWDVEAFRGRRARIRVVDDSNGGHISFDDFRFADERPPVIPVHEGGSTVFRDPDAPVWGFADLHTHPMSHLGFGGKFFSGDPDGPMEVALSGWGDAVRHGPGGTGFGGVGNLLFAAVEGGTGHLTDGWPTFDGWPSFRTKTHQQMYVDWIRRAYEGGQRILVALAVNNMLLAKEFGGGSDWTRYDDNTVVDRQIQAMKDMVARHSDWMEIAYSPADARRIIHSNKLAVVLGVEVDALGNCIYESDCTEAQVDAYLQHLYDQGVRQITPIHLTDNAFGAAAIYNDLFSVLNRFLRGEVGGGSDWNMYFQVEGGGSTGVQFRLGEHEDVAVKWYRVPSVLRGDSLYPYYEPPGYEVVSPGQGHVNRRSITDRGRFLLRRMMDRGMLIDIDHMSQKMTNEVLDIFERRAYPPVSSHTGLRHLAWLRGETSDIHKLPAESQKTRQQFERIRDLGGIIAPISNQGDVRDGRAGGPVANDCPGSSKTWAQAYLNLVDVMRGRGVAIGTDFNGLAGQPGPRFGTFACPGIAEDEIRLEIGRGYNRRRIYAGRQLNGVRYQTPVSDFRNYRFGEMGGPEELYDMEEHEIWEALALYKSGTDPARANITGVRTLVQLGKVRNLAKGFRAERYEQLENPLLGGQTYNEQTAAFMAKIGESAWRADSRIVERYNNDAALINLYEKVQRIWNLWHQMEGSNAPLIRSTAGRVEVAPGEFRPRDFDINLDGLAHYGMLPDFIQDLKNSGMGEADLQPLFRSAEEYIRTWERAERARGTG